MNMMNPPYNMPMSPASDIHMNHVNMPMSPAPDMPMNHVNMPVQPASNLEGMFPEIYRVMYPAVQNTVNIWIQQVPSPEGLSQSHMDYMVNQVLVLCDLTDNAEDMQAQAATLPYEAQRRPYHRPDRRHRLDIKDLAQILLLQELYRRYGYYPYPLYPYL